MNGLLVDADVLIDYLRGLRVAVDFIADNATRVILSAITVAELYGGVKGRDEEAVLEQLVSLYRVLPITTSIARRSGLFKRDFGKSHGIGLADAIVAATALAEPAELATLNVRHYPMLKGLRPAYLKK